MRKYLKSAWFHSKQEFRCRFQIQSGKSHIVKEPKPCQLWVEGPLGEFPTNRGPVTDCWEVKLPKPQDNRLAQRLMRKMVAPRFTEWKMVAHPSRRRRLMKQIAENQRKKNCTSCIMYFMYTSVQRMWNPVQKMEVSWKNFILRFLSYTRSRFTPTLQKAKNLLHGSWKNSARQQHSPSHDTLASFGWVICLICLKFQRWGIGCFQK